MPEARDAGPAARAAPQRFLIFRVAGRRYALPVDEVREVIVLPALARLPQSPRALLGLANLGGAVLPVVGLREVVGQAAAEHGGAAPAIVLDGAMPVALAVDAVDTLTTVDAGEIETGQAEPAAEAGEVLRGAFRLQSDQGVAKIIDIRAMLAGVFGRQARPGRAARERSAAAVTPQAGKAAGDQQVLVTFDVAGQEYALRLDSVREIIACPDRVAAAARAEAVLVGVMAYRSSLLALLSLRGLLGFPPAVEAENRAKVIVTHVGGVLVGLVADRMRAIVRAEANLIDPAPTMLAARAGGEAKIKAIFRGEGGRRLISILAGDQLFREDVMQRLGTAVPISRPDTQEAAGGEVRQFLIFRLGEDEFALPIAAVDEVASVPDRIARLPRTPEFLEGVINLRGEVLPVVDQRRRFGMAEFAGADARRLVVVRSARHRAGLIVDSVSEVMRVSADEIEPAPDLTDDMSRLVGAVINRPARGRVVLLLDPEELLTRAERGLLDGLDVGAVGQAGL